MKNLIFMLLFGFFIISCDGSRISKEQYDEITIGMTQENVEKELKVKAWTYTETTDEDGTRVKIQYNIEDRWEVNAYFYFKNGVLYEKSIY